MVRNLGGGRDTLGFWYPVGFICGGLAGIDLSGETGMVSGAGYITSSSVGGTVTCGDVTGMDGGVGRACTLGGDCGEWWELSGRAEKKVPESCLWQRLGRRQWY